MFRLIKQKLKDDYCYRKTAFRRFSIFSLIVACFCGTFGFLEFFIGNDRFDGAVLMFLCVVFSLVVIFTPEN